MMDWVSVFTRARRKHCYHVQVLEHTNFLDFGLRAVTTLKNLNKNTNEEKVNWLLIKVIKYTKSRQGEIEYKYNYSDDFKVLNVFGKKTTETIKAAITTSLSVKARNQS